MLNAADEQLARAGLLLEMTLQTERLVAFGQQFVVHRSVYRVTGDASLTHRFVFEDERPPLGGMTPDAGLVGAGKGGPHPPNAGSFVRIVTIAASHVAFRDGMMKRQVELAPLVEVTIKADLGRTIWIDDVVAPASSVRVDTARSMARFTAHLNGIRPFGHEVRVRGRRKWLGDLLVTISARRRTDKRRPLDMRRRNQRPAGVHARNQRQGSQQPDNAQGNVFPMRLCQAAARFQGGEFRSQFHRLSMSAKQTAAHECCSGLMSGIEPKIAQRHNRIVEIEAAL